MSVQISYKKQTVLLVLIFLIIISAVEGFSRVVLFSTDSCVQGLPMSGLYEKNMDFRQLCNDYKSITLYREGVVQLEPNQHTIHVNINEFGFRGPEISMDKQENTFRIFMVGGSTTYGLYSSSDLTTIPSFLQEKFDKLQLDSDIEVINAGISDASSYDEVYHIKNKILDFQPDMIVVYDGWNDLHQPLKIQYDNQTSKNNFEKQMKQIGQLYKSPQFIELVIKTVGKQIPQNTENDVSKTSNIGEKVDVWYDRWSEICHLSKNHNFEVIITLQPLMSVSNKILTDWESEILSKYGNPSIIQAYPEMREMIKKLDSQCTLAEDISDVFDHETDTIYYDFGHVGDKGNKIVAEKIYEKILPIVIKDIKK